MVEAIAAARADGYGVTVEPLPVSGPGWRRGAEVPGHLDELLAAVAEATGTRSPAATVTFFLEPYAWHLAAACVGALLCSGALPPLDDVQVHDTPEGWCDAIALPAGGWTPATGAELAARLEAHLAPLVGALASQRPTSALWRSVGDRLGQGALWAGAAFEDPDGAWDLLEAALAAPTTLRAACAAETADGRRFRRRTGCCLNHRSPDGPICPDCVIVRS
jgi:hypothetical protein